jgi:hypothetical protein
VRVRALTGGDLEWVVDRLAERRAALVPHAPVLWRPAADAAQAHRRFLGDVLGMAGTVGFRTDTGFLIAAPRAGGWSVDDMVVPPEQWATHGQALWAAFRQASRPSSVRFVCPVPEPDRAEFGRRQGLQLASSWWHRDVAPSSPSGQRDEPRAPQVQGATAQLVTAPRIYDPGGPVMYLTDVHDPASALSTAGADAARLGCPVIVVDQPHDDLALGVALHEAGYRRHCDFLDGTLADPASPD